MTNDKWVNHPIGAVNKQMGWNEIVLADGSKQSPYSGSGMKSLHMAFANSNAFSDGMADRVYSKICILPKNKQVQDEITKISSEFRQAQYNMQFLLDMLKRV